MKAARCRRCNYVGVRTSYVDRNTVTHFLDKSVKAFEDVYIILESKMNEPETFEAFKSRTYTRLDEKNTSRAG